MDWRIRMIVDQSSLKVLRDLHRAFSETDFRPAPRAITVIVYESAAHALPITHKDRLNADLLAFVKG